MNTLDKITQLLKEQKKNQSDLCMHLGLKKNTYTNWKSGANSSYKKYLPQIAEFFNVSVDYLLGNDSKTKITAEPDDFQAQQILDIYYSLNNDGKKQLYNVAMSMKLSGMFTQKNSDISVG